MELYSNMSETVQIFFGTFTLVLTMCSVYFFIESLIGLREKKYAVQSIFPFLMNVFILQGLGDFDRKKNGGQASSLADFFAQLPVFILCVIICIIFLCEVGLYAMIRRKINNSLTPSGIKESIDAMPDGVCFYTTEGIPLLVNVQMNNISADLFGHHIMNGHVFFNGIKSFSESISPIFAGEERKGRKKKRIIVETSDHRIWKFKFYKLKINGKEVHELIAYDVSEQHSLNEELNKKNERLNKIGERLRELNKDIERVTKEKEILSAKIRLHDEVGRSLLGIRYYLSLPFEERNRSSVVPSLEYIVTLMLHEENEKKDDDWDSVVLSANSLNLNIVKCGELPENIWVRCLLISAVRTAAGNAIEHAEAKNLFVEISENEENYLFVFKNDGKTPENEIVERGGLKNLRQTVTDFGGSMQICSHPLFELRIIISKGDVKNEENKGHHH